MLKLKFIQKISKFIIILLILAYSTFQSNTLCAEGNLDGECKQFCSFNQYPDPKTSKCLKCHSSCLSCRGPNAEDCMNCHVTCGYCHGEGYNECQQCQTGKRNKIEFLDRPWGECNCKIDNSEENLQTNCSDSLSAYSVKQTSLVISIITLVLLFINSILQQNPLLLLRYIDNMQQLSFMLFINAKQALNLDEIFFQFLEIYHPTNWFSVRKVAIFTDYYQKNKQLLYGGNPKFFSTARRTSIFIINAFELLIMHTSVWIFIFLILIILQYYGRFRNQERKGIVKARRILQHTILVHLFILTISEFSLCVPMQLINFNTTTSMQTISIVLSIATICYFLGFYIYFLRRHFKRMKSIELLKEEETKNKNSSVPESQLVPGQNQGNLIPTDSLISIRIEVKQTKGISSRDNVIILSRKIIVSMILAVLFHYPLIQAILMSFSYLYYTGAFIFYNKIDNPKKKFVIVQDVLFLIQHICIICSVASSESSTKVDSTKAFFCFFLLYLLFYCLYVVATSISWILLYQYNQNKPEFIDYELKLQQSQKTLFKLDQENFQKRKSELTINQDISNNNNNKEAQLELQMLQNDISSNQIKDAQLTLGSNRNEKLQKRNLNNFAFNGQSSGIKVSVLDNSGQQNNPDVFNKMNDSNSNNNQNNDKSQSILKVKKKKKKKINKQKDEEQGKQTEQDQIKMLEHLKEINKFTNQDLQSAHQDQQSDHLNQQSQPIDSLRSVNNRLLESESPFLRSNDENISIIQDRHSLQQEQDNSLLDSRNQKNNDQDQQEQNLEEI